MRFPRRPELAVVLLMTALMLVIPSTAPAQGNVGTIDGRVLDQSRAAAPGATVTAKNGATGLRATARRRALSRAWLT